MSNEKVEAPNRNLVRKVQEAVGRATKASPREYADRLRNAIKESAVNPRLMKVIAHSEDTEQNSLRVTCPSKSVASAEVKTGQLPHWIEFFLTRPRADGVAETRLLGKTKYPDGDGVWRLRFQSERFARTPHDPLVIHAEAFDEAGRLVAANATILVE